jgi:hypothetical protein
MKGVKMSKTEQKNEQSKTSKKYFELELREDEYIVTDVERHFLGRLRIWAMIVAIALFFLLVALLFWAGPVVLGNYGALVAMFFVFLALITPLFGMMVVRDYDGDWLVVTNLRLIQNVRHTVFASENQEIGLDGVEDVSFAQRNVFEKVFNYGTVRLSTIGDEHTYIFTWVDNPAQQVKLIRSAVTEYHEHHSNAKHTVGHHKF